MEPVLIALRQLTDRMASFETAVREKLDNLAQSRASKDWYTIPEAAKLLGKAEFTLREHARLGRIHAKKRECGRGRAGEWVISHAELIRIQNEGLLPIKNPDRHVQ